MRPLSRRAWLATMAGLAASWPLQALADRGDVRFGKRGLTLRLELKSAPFPDGMHAYHDASVWVFVPWHYRLGDDQRVDVLVHFHGHNTNAERAMVHHELREQLYDSRQNAILVVPQGPELAADGHFGKLMARGGLSRMLAELVRTLAGSAYDARLEDASLAGAKGVGTVCISAHSGGYRATAACLIHGGVEVSEVYLFDALYGEVDVFRRWVLEKKDETGAARHKLISHYAGGAVRENNMRLMEQLRAGGVDCLHEERPGQLTRSELTRGRAIFVATPLSHAQVGFGHNGLRDCLYASTFERHLASDWFEHKDRSRRIDHRGSS